jgi:hypothetical protein
LNTNVMILDAVSGDGDGIGDGYDDFGEWWNRWRWWWSRRRRSSNKESREIVWKFS